MCFSNIDICISVSAGFYTFMFCPFILSVALYFSSLCTSSWICMWTCLRHIFHKAISEKFIMWNMHLMLGRHFSLIFSFFFNEKIFDSGLLSSHRTPVQFSSPPYTPPPQMQRSYSSPDNLQKHAVVRFYFLYEHNDRGLHSLEFK